MTVAALLALAASAACGEPAAGAGPGPVTGTADGTGDGASTLVVSPEAARRGNALSLLRLEVTPGIEISLEGGLVLVDPGATTDLRGSFPLAPWLEFAGNFSYSWLPVRAKTSLSVGTASVGPLLRHEFTPRFNTWAYLGAGGHYGFLNNRLLDPDGRVYPDQQGGGTALLAAGGADFFLSPTLSIGLQASWAEYLGLLRGLRVSFGTAFHMDGLARKVEVAETGSSELFPSLAKGYATRRLATVSIRNRERFPLEKVSVGLYVKDLMDAPTKTTLPARLRPGDFATLDLGALLSDRVLAMVEDGTYPVEFRCSFVLNGRERETLSRGSILVHNRNAIVWDDDRKIASFMDPNAPETLAFAKPVAVMARNEAPPSLDLALRMGMALFEALGAAGVGYVVDPNTPSYQDSSKDRSIVDFVQYAKQTLAFRGGDCDDLTTLDCSLLEAVGVETGFITVPGHIYAAFALDMGAAEAKRFFSSVDDLIVVAGRAWIPVEVTAVGQPFLAAWTLGAREWREASAKGEAVFQQVHEAWQSYQVAGSPPEIFTIVEPSPVKVFTRFDASIADLVAREMSPKAGALLAAIGKKESPARNWDALGVLYARYGRLDQAEAAFLSSLSLEERVPTLVNLATLYRLMGDPARALDSLGRAERVDPADSRVLLGKALAHYELQNFAMARSYYSRAAKAAPEAAARFAYLDQGPGSGTARGSDIQGREATTWSDED